jgi:hypothetical protein
MIVKLSLILDEVKVTAAAKKEAQSDKQSLRSGDLKTEIVEAEVVEEKPKVKRASSGSKKEATAPAGGKKS